MKLFEGKSPSERNKIIVALVLGVLSVLALGNMIFAPFSGPKKSVTVTVSPTASATPAPNRAGDTVVTALPQQNEIDGVYASTALFVQYPPGASDPGRNIFAFYEPPVPTPYSPTPVPVTPIKTPPPPTPAPPPPLTVTFISRQSAYAGERSFRLDVGGDKFTPGTYVFFNGAQLPTNYVNAQQLSAEIPANFIANAGQMRIEVKSPDGALYSNPLYFNVQQPPAPQFQYLGVVARKRGNNDTAYIMEPGKTLPTTARLGDPIGGRFRLVSITPTKLLVKDTQLDFLPPYSIELVKGSGQISSSPTDFNTRRNQGFNDSIVVQPPQPPSTQCPPGIPCNTIRPYQTPQPQKKDEDVDDDDDGDN
ncbi:MAG TPA: hypothetical protein VIL74_12285 [Pyrinomonadaceae bacterium]|jgi:hypothetical protein